jgi:PhoH-like ATPase
MASKQQKIFVIDTSVIIFDHMSIHNFEEHDIAIPIAVLEELDNFKKGNDSRNFEARSFIRMLDEIGGTESLLDQWVSLNSKKKNKGKIMVATHLGALSTDAELVFGEEKNDHKIINSAIKIKDSHPSARVVLVTKDICLRVKAKSLNLFAEDYKTGKIKDADDLYTGKKAIDNVSEKLIDDLFEDKIVDYKDLKIEKPYHNQFFILRNHAKSVLSFYNSALDKMERVDKLTICKVKPKNAEQTFALYALMNPKIQLITLRGMAGTGKTLLAIAAAIEQKKQYQQIYITRPVIPLGNNDIGFLPGDIKSKMDPYMQPIYDNIKYIKNQYGESDGMTKRINQMIEQEKIAIAPLAYIRGRTLANAFFIVDEAQNLTPHEVKTIISRAGEGTKIVLTGDINQIDTPYLDAESNGLSYVIDKVKNNALFAHITLEKGERSELANLANDLL